MTTETLEDIITRKVGDFSPLSLAILASVIMEWRDDEHDAWDILPQIEAVLDGNESTFGAEFDERVQEAMSFTPDPFSGVCDSDI